MPDDAVRTMPAAPPSAADAEVTSTPHEVPAGPVWSFREPQNPAGVRAAHDGSQVEFPFAIPETSTVSPRPQPMFGPIGSPRPAALVPLLSVVTLGAYALVWHQKTTRELEEFDPKLRVRAARSTLALALPWLVGLLATIAGAVLLLTERLSLHIPLSMRLGTVAAYGLLAGLAAVPYLILLLPFSAVAVVMTLERVRCVEEHVGRTTDQQVRPVATSLLLAVPVIGGLVLIAVEQRRINAIWDAVAPTGRRSS